VNVTEISGSMNDDGNNGYVFEFDVTCLLKNNDSRSVTIDEVEYVVYIEGIESEQHNYSDYYSTDLVVAGDGESTVNLPLTLTLDAANGALLATAIQDGDIDFVVEGTFHVKELEGNSTDFSLPLYIEGSVDASIMGDLFQQPTIKITGYSLQELPGDSTYLEIDMLVTNNDNREVYIKDIEYLAVIEGIEAREEKEEIGKTILVGTPLELTLPLTLFTQDAIQLLTMLDAGESLDYVVTGIFHVDEPVLNMFELPIDISGSATVETGFEEFYEQPDIVVNDIEGSYSINGITSYTFNLDVNCTVTNQDSRAVEIDEVEYVVTVEGVRSSEHLYSDAYDTNIQISGGEAIDLTLPVTLNLGISSGASLAGALLDGTASYIIEGTFHAILVDGTAVDFKLPLYDTGSVPVTMIGK